MRRLRTEYGAFSERNHADGFSRIGLPDIESCLNGYYFAVEAKADYASWRKWRDDKSDEAPTQKQTIQEIREANGVAFCTYLWDDVALAADMICAGFNPMEINAAVDEKQKTYVPDKGSRRRRAVPDSSIRKSRSKDTAAGSPAVVSHSGKAY